MDAYCYFEFKNTEAKEANTEGIFKRSVAGEVRDCYRCNYWFDEKRKRIWVRVFYDAKQEIEDKEPKPRDMFIFDVFSGKDEGNVYLLKNACRGLYYTSNDGNILKDRLGFFSKEWFFSNKDQEQDLFEFFEKKSEPEVKSIRIYFTELLEHVDEWKIYTDVYNGKINIDNNKNNNVSEISMFFEMSGKCFTACGIEIHLEEAIDYSQIRDYLREIMVYFQLFSPNLIYFDEVDVKVGEKYYHFATEYNFDCREKMRPVKKDKDSNVELSGVNLLKFLKNCYEKLSYRCSDDGIRSNIDDVIFISSYDIRDKFLDYFRFIESFLKKYIKLLVDKLKDNNSLTDKEEKYIKNFYGQLKDKKELTYKDVEDILKLEESEDINNALKEIKKILNENLESCKYRKYIENLKIDIGDTANEKIMRWAIKKSLDAIKKYGEDLKNSKDIQKCSFKIVSLRNHYTHCGYYIPDEGIKYGTGDNCKKVGIPDVYKLLRTVLFPIAMDIIFKDILGYEHYEFPSPFPEDLF